MPDTGLRVPPRWVRPEQIDTGCSLAAAFTECCAGAMIVELVKAAQAHGWWKPFEESEVRAAFTACHANGSDEEYDKLKACLEQRELVRKGDDGKYRVTDECIARCVVAAPARLPDVSQ